MLYSSSRVPVDMIILMDVVSKVRVVDAARRILKVLFAVIIESCTINITVFRYCVFRASIIASNTYFYANPNFHYSDFAKPCAFEHKNLSLIALQSVLDIFDKKVNCFFNNCCTFEINMFTIGEFDLFFDD